MKSVRGGQSPFRWQDLSSSESLLAKKLWCFRCPVPSPLPAPPTTLPRYEELMKGSARLGVDQSSVVSVNDAFRDVKVGSERGRQECLLLPMARRTSPREMGNVGGRSRTWPWSAFAGAIRWWVNDGNDRESFAEAGARTTGRTDPSKSPRRRHDAGLTWKSAWQPTASAAPGFEFAGWAKYRPVHPIRWLPVNLPIERPLPI